MKAGELERCAAREIGIGAADADRFGGTADARLRLPEIGAQSTLADVLKLLGHAPVDVRLPERRFANRRVHRGHALVHANQPLENLYVVLSGSFKSTLTEAEGSQQIVAFPMRGDLIGLDAIQGARYPATITALEEANVAAIPYAELTSLARLCPYLERALMTAVSAELVRNYQVMRAIGVLGAEGRVVRFLHELGARAARFGFSARALRLPMTRADIASYLGMSIETVSRAFSSLAAQGLIEVRRRSIRVLDPERLGRAEDARSRTAPPSRAVALSLPASGARRPRQPFDRAA